MARKCNPKSEILIACRNFIFLRIQIKGDLKMREKKAQCTCKICGKQFLGANTQAKFCSLRCIYDDQNAKRKAKIKDSYNICQICGAVFKTRKPNENTCSPECKKKRKAKQDKEYHERHKTEISLKSKKHREENQEYIINYRKTHKERARETGRKYSREVQHKYCIKGQERLVENYEQALAEDFENWSRHHKLETHNSDGEKRLVPLTSRELKALGVYYNRPAEELIWLRTEEHRRLHHRFTRKDWQC